MRKQNRKRVRGNVLVKLAVRQAKGNEKNRNSQGACLVEQKRQTLQCRKAGGIKYFKRNRRKGVGCSKEGARIKKFT